MEIWTVALLIISGVLFAGICTALYWYYRNIRREHALLYSPGDTYSDLGSEVKFEGSKNKKVWIGPRGLGNIIKDQKRELLREQYDSYASAMKIAKNWCNFTNMMDTQNERKMADELPCIGHRRFSKFFHPMFDEKYGSQKITKKKKESKRLLLYHYDCSQLPPLDENLMNMDNDSSRQIALGKGRIFDSFNDEQYRAFRLIFETLEHSYLMRTYEINQSKDKRHLFLIRDLEKKGSLRDMVHSCDLSGAYGDKYTTPGKPLYIRQIRKYGRQILEGMSYLSRCGLTHYHLHSGNVIIQNDNAKLSEIENVFFGYQLRHPLHQHLEALKKIYCDLDVEVCLFGYILFEMATGFESPTPSPLDCLHEMPRKLDENILNILGRVFGDLSLGNNPRIDDLINEPFFNATNVPRGDVSMFISLKNENKTVNELVNAVLNQCYYTYSSEALLGKKNVKRDKDKKKKKKKKKRKRKEQTQNIEMEEKQQVVDTNQLEFEEVVKVEQKERDSADDDLWSSQ